MSDDFEARAIERWRERIATEELVRLDLDELAVVIELIAHLRRIQVIAPSLDKRKAMLGALCDALEDASPDWPASWRSK